MGLKCKEIKYGILQKIFGFHEWHATPIEKKAYGMEVIKWCNRLLEKDKDACNGRVIEVGCGLGDILAKINIKKENKTGYDIDEKVIRAAKIIHPNINFQVGNFAPDIKGLRISIFITINFLYSLDYKTVEEQFKKLIINNDIKYILTETMYPVTPNYPHSHDFNSILGNEYVCIRKRGFPAAEHSRRYILLYAKKEKNNEMMG